MSTKQRMIEATAESLRRNGLAGTSFTDVLAASGAARGAIYHHFPGGKAELARAAVEYSGARAAEAFAGLPPSASPLAAIDAFLSLIRPIVEQASLGAGCAVAAAAVEVDADSPIHGATREAFARWQAVLADRLNAAGASREDAAALASLLLTTLEGAHVLCRAEGSIEPFDRAASALRAWSR